MFRMSRLERHEKLVDAMAEAQGVDLTEAMMRGDLSGTELRGAIFSCTGCTDPDDCAARLEAGETGMPDYCRNAGLFERLMAG